MRIVGGPIVMETRVSAPVSAVADRRTLLFSLQNLVPAAWNGVFYELFEVLKQIENATFVAPRPGGEQWSRWEGYRKLRQRAMIRLGKSCAVTAPPTQVEGEFDLAFFACQFPRQIPEINSVPGWRERSRKACVFVLETWSTAVEEQKEFYRHLDAFDHVFVFCQASAPLIQRYTKAPVTYLPTATDTLMLPERAYARERTVDYLCIGRRHAPVHAAMYDYACRNDRFYLFDLWKVKEVKEWGAARRQNADMGSRAKHFFVWPPFRPLPGGKFETAISTRYFEGARSGAVMIGAAPKVPEFEGLFSTPEPVIEMPEDPALVHAFLDRLDAEAAHFAEIGRSNRLDSLERHDWAHRWAEILGIMGLPASVGLETRLAELRRRRLSEDGTRPRLVHPAAAPPAEPATTHAGSATHA